MVAGGLTGVIGTPTLGCCVIKIATGVQVVSLGYNQLPSSISVLNGSNYDTYVRTSGSVGWVVVNPSAYLPLTGGALTGQVSTNQTPTLSTHLVPKLYVDTNAIRCTVGDLGLRIIRGNVNSNSTITQGSGFTMSKLVTGVYNINFTTPFTIIPSLSFIPYTVLMTGIGNITTTFAQIYMTTTAGVFTDSGFTFILIGTN
jgi:hypothetical protein